MVARLALDGARCRVETLCVAHPAAPPSPYDREEFIVLKSSLKYAKRVIRMTSMLRSGTVQWGSYKMGLRPGQMAVLAAGGGFVFCDEATEDMAFPE